MSAALVEAQLYHLEYFQLLERERKGKREERRKKIDLLSPHNRKSGSTQRKVHGWIIQKPKDISKDLDSFCLLCLILHVELLSSGLSPSPKVAAAVAEKGSHPCLASLFESEE